LNSCPTVPVKRRLHAQSVLTQNGHPRTLGGHFNEEVRRCPTLPQGPPCSTIGAKSLSFRVRNVTGRFPLAMAAETLLMYQSEQANQHAVRTQWCCLRVLDRTSRTTQWTRSIFVFKQRKCYQIIGLLVPVSSESLSSSLPHPAYQPSSLAGSLSPEGMEISS
jgi:hypothetical protein